MTTQTLDDIRAGLAEVGLEQAIRELAARGEISDLGLTMNGKGTLWRATFVPCSVFGQSFAEDADPCKALLLALTTVKLRKKRTPTKDSLVVGVIPQETVDVVPEPAAEDPAADLM